jgi:hypothetical protein
MHSHTRRLLRIFSVPLISLQLAAATTSGVISQDETWSGNILLTGDVTVATNVTLTIMPGTRVECAPRFDDRVGGINISLIELTIDGGSLMAAGTEAEPIIFTSAATTSYRGDWFGIRAISATVVLNRCELSCASIGLLVRGGPPPVVQSCRFFYNTTGARVENLAGATTTFVNCTFDGSSYAGIELSSMGEFRLVSSVVHQCVSAFRGNAALLQLVDCTISNNGRGTVGGGGVVYGTGAVIVRDSAFMGNLIGIADRSASITNSIFASNTVAAVTGSGVMVGCKVRDNAPGVSDSIAVAGGFDLYNCEIVGNRSGVSCQTIVDSTVEGNYDLGISAVNVTNCIVRNNGSGVRLAGPLSTMKDCLVESNRSWGVSCSTARAVQANVVGCTVARNGGMGIIGSHLGGAFITIRNCTVEENAIHGIDASATTTVIGNRIAGNGWAGIEFDAALQSGSFIGNIIQSNRVGLLAVFPAQSASATGMTNNVISDNIEYELQNSSAGTIIADGNYWGNPTTAELTGGVENLSRIYDSHDAPLASGRVIIDRWSESPVFGGPVTIVQQLQDQSVEIGGNVSWTVVAEGQGTLVYQWFKDGAVIGDGSDTLHLSQVELEDAGLYSVVVGNQFSSASSSVRLTVTGEFSTPPPLLDLASYAGLTIYGTPGKSYQIDYATDPASPVWTPLTNITLSTSHYFVLDTESGWPSKRFYRAVETPVQ